MTFFANNIDSIAWSLIVAVAVVAAVLDIRQLRVPNALTLPLGVSGVVFHTTLWGLSGLRFSATGLVVGCLVLILFFFVGAMGAGDIKLLGGIGAWLGATNAISICLIACLAAGVYSLGVLAVRGGRTRFLPVPAYVPHGQMRSPSRPIGLEQSVDVVARCEDRRWRVLPFALMIAIAVLLIAFGEYGVSFLRQGWAA